MIQADLSTALRMADPEIRHTTSAQPTRIIRFHVRMRERPTVGMSAERLTQVPHRTDLSAVAHRRLGDSALHIVEFSRAGHPCYHGAKTMALFSRRCLQRLIQENARFLSSQQLDEHLRRLNTVRDDYLATEWEIAVLNSFSKVGNIRHEPHDFAGSRFLDVVFESPAIQFGAEIATVSDQRLHKRNPGDRIWEELQRQVRKRKITTGGFDVNIGHPPAALQGRGIRHDLLIPPVAKLKEVVFNAQFNRFMEQISSDPASTQHFQVRNSIADIKITYDPNRRTWGGSHLAYTGANILDDNPVF